MGIKIVIGGALLCGIVIAAHFLKKYKQFSERGKIMSIRNAQESYVRNPELCEKSKKPFAGELGKVRVVLGKPLKSEIKKQSPEQELAAANKKLTETEQELAAANKKLTETEQELAAAEQKYKDLNEKLITMFASINKESEDLWKALQWLLGFARLSEEKYEFSNLELKSYDNIIIGNLTMFQEKARSAPYLLDIILDLLKMSSLERTEMHKKKFMLLKALDSDIRGIPVRGSDNWQQNCVERAQAIRKILEDNDISVLFYDEAESGDTRFTNGTDTMFEVPILTFNGKPFSNCSGYYRNR